MKLFGFIISVILLTFLLMNSSLQVSQNYEPFVEKQPYRHVYDPTTLRSLRPPPLNCVHNTPNLEHDRTQKPKKKNKRGKKGGVKARMARRQKRPVLPVVITGNVRSLNNIHDELQAYVRYLNEYRNASMICLSESWLKEGMEDSSFQLDNFTLKRSDRDIKNLKKTCAGGVCAYINKRWCHENNVHVMKKQCTADCEILCLSLRPYYLPREFNKIIVNVVYIPCDANTETAITELTDILNHQLSSSPDSVIITTGDFNRRNLDPSLPFDQHVTCATRQDSTLDLFYSNVPNGFKSKALPPLGSSDHNMILLMPKYKTKLKTIKTEVKTVFIWNSDACERLKGCFACTDWSVFCNSCESLEELNDVVSSYVRFCQESTLEKKTIKCFGNNKPWVTKELKQLLNDKKRAFMEKNNEKKKAVQKELKDKIKECQKKYKNKIEEKFRSNNLKCVWKGMKDIVGYSDKRPSVYLEKGKEQEYVDQLNTFYARFDRLDFSEQIDDIRNKLKDNDDTQIAVNENEVNTLFSYLKLNKACGPDNITPRVLKTCSDELCGIYSYIFNLSLELNEIPNAWKMSRISPVPKCSNIQQMNDLRPVALTSILMKCLERIVLKTILITSGPFLDPLQFAYKSKRGVEDAILYFTDNLYHHLDVPKSYVRTLFVDFSSAFNTIQPHILIPKLLNMGLNKNVTLWILDFLTKRPQFVRLKSEHEIYESSVIITNTGAPQGTVLAPVLFSIYTNDCKTVFENVPIIKYADDTSIQALIRSDVDLCNYNLEIKRFVRWCEDNYLQLNVKKTKEMIFDFRKINNHHDDITIKDGKVERVKEYKYLGIIFDEKLEWQQQSNKVLKNINKRMYFMRKLHKFQIDNMLIKLFYQTCIKSVLTFSLTAWGGNIRENEKRKIDRTLKYAGKMIKNVERDSFENVHKKQCKSKLHNIINDSSHPLYPQIKTSERSGRLIHLRSRTERYFRSFLPTAVRISND